MVDRVIRIGGASGYWGDADMAVPQLLADGGLDFITFDYLAEITMSIMARARAKDPEAGYATDFVTSALVPNLKEIARQGIRIISNAGGVNPKACAAAVENHIGNQGLDLKVACITGDDLMARAPEFAGADTREMFSGDAFPEISSIASINAYFGAFPIAAALDAGADIVITGRCVDSAVTLGACIHAFGWKAGDLDQLAAGSLAGHLIECGPQATGGNFSDWHQVADTMAEIGYPIAEIEAAGACTITKPDGSGGMVSFGTVGEQMLYEIGDPAHYELPDVTCDFRQVRLEQQGVDRVRVTGAKGHPPPAGLKTSLTFADGWRIGFVWFFIGEDTVKKARAFADAALARTRRKLRAMNAPDYSETLVEIIGNESHYGDYAVTEKNREVALKVAAKHPDARACGLLLKEATGLALGGPPGLAPFAASRPRPSPVVRLFSFLVPRESVPVTLTIDGGERTVELPGSSASIAVAATPPAPAPAELKDDAIQVPLIQLAFGRSGDKGNHANIGLLPRLEDFAPYIWQALPEAEIRARFGHFLERDSKVHRYFLPGTGAMNIVLENVLGGGGIASLRNDPQGKSYAQILLQTPVSIPESLLEQVPS